MKIYIGSDHAGYKLKETLKNYLSELGHSVEDKGAFDFDVNDDYPDFVAPVAKEIENDENAKGIVLGGSGEGEAMVANRYEGVRAIEYYGGNLEIIRLGREHNDANILSLGARFLNEEEAKKAIKIFLETNFSDSERHIRRIEEMDQV